MWSSRKEKAPTADRAVGANEVAVPPNFAGHLTASRLGEPRRLDAPSRRLAPAHGGFRPSLLRSFQGSGSVGGSGRMFGGEGGAGLARSPARWNASRAYSFP